MRAGWLVLVIAACSPKGPSGPMLREDDPELRGARPANDPAPAPDEHRTEAPPGKGLRTGTIARARLVAVLDAGLPVFLQQVEVDARTQGNKFVGWQLVQLLDKTGPLHDLDLVPGDVLLAINGQAISRPEQAQQVWDGLRTANQVTAQLWRGTQQLELRFTIDPPVQITK
ncbi:MAG TPA: hypothetical protein VGC42_24140 [Kofleriaceae bacterium]